ncbi:DNA ligase [Thraustotheca clavata]|uniref:DNA ligase 1 n=1 Tax=Thraustotheca clavata TaxID=74557 RepID=A0A1V9YTN2_9STRA|nr:DNA ligase [Thraustotheca clavata]
MLFRDLTAAFRRIQAMNSRDDSIAELALTYRKIRNSNSNALPRAVYLTTSQLAPSHIGVELRFRDKSFAPVISEAFQTQNKSIDQNEILELYKSTGDYGTVIEELWTKLDLNSLENPTSAMSIDVVFEYTALNSISILRFNRELEALSKQVGKGSTARKKDIAIKLLQQCQTPEEAKFLVRLLVHQNLRIGVGLKTAVSALAIAFLPNDEIDNIKPTKYLSSVTTAYSQRPSFEDLVDVLQTCTKQHSSINDIADCILRKATPKPGTPIQTMLGYPSSSLNDIIKRMSKQQVSNAACEYKYDGARLQIHIEDITKWRAIGVGLSIFSRNMEKIPSDHKYYRMLSNSLDFLPHVNSVILEGEMVAIDAVSQKLLPFQVLQVKEEESMCFFAFDCLYLNNQSLIQEPFHLRREKLHSSLNVVPGDIKLVESVDINMESENALELLEAVLQAAIDADCEGLMVKSIGERYSAGARTHTWLKIKGDYLNTSPETSSGIFLPDTLDLVPIAAYRGKGRRANVFGSFLMACFNPSTNTFETVGNVGSGFTDDQLEAISAEINDQILSTKPLEYVASELPSVQPDVWLSPTNVWEIRAAQLTLSSKYVAGHKILSKGLGVRFPRFVRIRDDKNPTGATTADQLVEMYRTATEDS